MQNTTKSIHFHVEATKKDTAKFFSFFSKNIKFNLKFAFCSLMLKLIDSTLMACGLSFMVFLFKFSTQL